MPRDPFGEMPEAVLPPGDDGSQRRRRARLFATTCSNAIMATTFEPLRWTVPGYVPEGLAILAGRQKLGKTWLAIDFAVAVAVGGVAMGSIECEPGDVLYIDLENGPRRIQRRLQTLFPYHERSGPDLARLHWATESPPLGPEFISACEAWRQSVTKPALIVVDVLQRIKPAGSVARNSYENDYSALSDLQRWATESGVSVLVLHHTRKGGADDPLEALSGSNGLSACADTTLVLDRTAAGTTLYVRGRDVDEKETAIDFALGRWSILGDAATVHRTDERSEILSVLIDAAEPISPRDIAVATGMPRNGVDQLLYKMGKAGEVLKSGRGRYVHPDNRHLIEGEPHKAAKIDKKIRNSAAGQRSQGSAPGGRDQGADLDLIDPGETDKFADMKIWVGRDETFADLPAPARLSKDALTRWDSVILSNIRTESLSDNREANMRFHVWAHAIADELESRDDE